jgi:hypothetical protein
MLDGLDYSVSGGDHGKIKGSAALSAAAVT